MIAATCLFKDGVALGIQQPDIASARRDDEWSINPSIIKASIDAMNTAWFVNVGTLGPTPFGIGPQILFPSNAEDMKYSNHCIILTK